MFNPMRKNRRVYSLSRNARPAGVRGFWPGTRGSFRRVTNYRRVPRLGLIRNTYTIPEKKFADSTQINSVVSNTGGVLLVNGLQQGTGSTTRIGQQVVWRSLHFKFYIDGRSINTTTPNANDWTTKVRVMLVWDTQPNGLTPTISDVLESAGTGTGIVSSLNKANGARFKILFDRRYTAQHTWYVPGPPPAISLGNPSANYDEVYLKMNHRTDYANTSAGTVADIKTGALFLISLSDTATTDEYPFFSFWLRLRYTDN